MTSDHSPDDVINRRNLLRGGTLAAAGAGAAVLASAAVPRAAFAADGDELLVGEDNEASSTTSLTQGGTAGNSNPTLTLANANGPALRLQPLPDNWRGDLALGDIAATPSGPLVGVADDGGTTTARLLTELNVEDLFREFPITIPIPPQRYLDTRQGAANDEQILDTSPSALDREYRLRSKSWLDLRLVEADEDFTVHAVFLKLTSVGSREDGYLTAYQPGPRPVSSSVNYLEGETLGGAAFASVGIVDNIFAVRIYTSQTTHLVVDVTGAVITNVPPAQLLAGKRASRYTKAADRLQRAFST